MISIVKLTSGTEIVGSVEHENSHEIVLGNPLQINYRYFTGPVPSVSFVRYIMFAQAESVTFDKMHVLHVVQARESFARFYGTAVKQFSKDVVQMIDDELSDVPTEVSRDQLESALESMSVEGMTVN